MRNILTAADFLNEGFKPAARMRLEIWEAMSVEQREQFVSDTLCPRLKKSCHEVHVLETSTHVIFFSK